MPCFWTLFAGGITFFSQLVNKNEVFSATFRRIIASYSYIIYYTVMKTYKTIDEAIHEMATGQIGVRRRMPVVSMIIFFAGIAIIGSVYYIGAIRENPMVANVMLLAGILTACIGVARIIMVLRNRILYYIPSGSELRRYELPFDTPYLMKVCQCIDEGNLEALRGIPRGKSSGLKAVIYKTEDNDVLFSQAMDSSRPLTEAKLFPKGTFNLTGILI